MHRQNGQKFKRFDLLACCSRRGRVQEVEHLENLNFEKSICKFRSRIGPRCRCHELDIHECFWLMVHRLCTVYTVALRANATNYNQNHTRTHQSPMSLKFKFYVLDGIDVVVAAAAALLLRVCSHKSTELNGRNIWYSSSRVQLNRSSFDIVYTRWINTPVAQLAIRL